MKYIILFLGFFLSFYVRAQKTDTLLIDEINIIKTFDPKLKESFKISSNPILVDTVIEVKPMNYTTVTNFLENKVTPDTISASKIKWGETVSKLDRGYIKLGAGTNLTPLAEFYYNGLRSKEYSYGLSYKHLSSQGQIKRYPTSFYSNNDIKVYGKRFFEKTTLSSDFTYNRRMVYYYGVNQEYFQNYLDSANKYGSILGVDKQIYSTYTTHINLTKTKKEDSKLYYDFGLNFYNFSNRFTAKEKYLGFTSAIIQPLRNEKLIVDIDLDFYNSKIDYITNKQILTYYNNTILKVAPAVLFEKENFSIKLGVIANADVDSSASNFRIAPDAELNIYLVDKIYKVYVGVTGGLEKNSFSSITNTNPFIELVSTNLVNSNVKYKGYLGLKGSLSVNASFGVEVSHKDVSNMPLYVSLYRSKLSSLAGIQNKMSVLYDNVQETNVKAEFSYSLTEKMKLFTKMNFFHYKTQIEKEAWHKPNFDFTISSHYKINKFTLKGDVYLIGNRKAVNYDFTTNGNSVFGVSNIEVLSPIVDVNLGADYKHTEKLVFFFDLYNLANQQQFLWNNYPSQGINVMLGAKFSF